MHCPKHLLDVLITGARNVLSANALKVARDLPLFTLAGKAKSIALGNDAAKCCVLSNGFEDALRDLNVVRT